MKVREYIAAQVLTAKPTDTIENVARTMSETDISAIPLIDDDVVVGIITDSDIVIRMVAEQKDGLRRCPMS